MTLGTCLIMIMINIDVLVTMETHFKVNGLENNFGCGTHFCATHKTIDHRSAQISPIMIR